MDPAPDAAEGGGVIGRHRILGELAIDGIEDSRGGRLRSPFERVGRRVPLPRGTRAAIAAQAGDRADEVAGSKVVYAIVGVAAALVLAKPPVAYAAAPLFAAGGWQVPNLGLRRRGRDVEERVRSALPDALDLMAACALAGMGVDQAVRVVAREAGGPLGEALEGMVRALDAGTPRAAAYEVLVARAPAPEVQGLVRALRRAERYGTPVAPVLVAQARELRARRRAQAEEAARAAPVRMLFPLVLCFLPAFVLLTVAPIVLTALRSFRTP